ncbi:MAG TPA: patatin-like protein [Pyrinomonadaceae bacterium]|nr:patatin-like protein [Pyrinomonadaceae bacterium]
MTTPSMEPEHTKEVRLAIVMYGGVSLAIYINGIAQELLRLVRATARKQSANFSGTERIYRKVSYLLDDETLTMEELDKASADTSALPPTRFVVDILSGTSAGGINAIFLAKALANGQDMEELKNLWVTEGDIETLINDRRSIEKPLELQDPPTSLLNSERMYFKLLKAFEGMDQSVPARKDTDESPFVNELDLFVTSTDLQGVVLPIRLSDDLVYERRHRNVMRFIYSERSVSGEDTRNDFLPKYNPFLAFAARCTSSFPFAFEPMCLTDTEGILKKLNNNGANGDCSAASPLWQRFYRDYLDPRGVSSVPFYNRAFGDGGYLDNKPFSYATEALMNRNADVPVDRKLIYIEPSPEHPEDDVERDKKPDAIENVMSALLTLPRYETIREDLERVQERNRLIDRINSITSGVDRDADIVQLQASIIPGNEYECWKELGALAPLPSDSKWAKEFATDADVADLDLADMIKRKGRAYAAYHRLRISAVTDQLAKLIARVAGFDEESDYFIIIRSMVRAWRVKNYVEHRHGPEDEDKPTANRFLYEFDLSYPIRRVNYLRNKADALHRQERNAKTVINIQARNFGLDPEKQPFTELQEAAFQDELLTFKKTLNELFVKLRHAGRSLRSRHDPKEPVKKDDDKTPSEGMAKVSPVKDEVKLLMDQIRDTVKKVAPDPESPSMILDYFLGKRDDPAVFEGNRSYRKGSPEEECVVRSQAFLEEHPELLDQFATTAKALAANIVEIKEEVEQKSIALFSSKSTGEPVSGDLQIDSVIWIARNAMRHYYDNYEDYDLLTYPILYESGVGEADTIDIIRISPEDAKQLIDERKTGCHKLAGSALGHFGAFLARQWRQNDILWGRLDGAERLISALLPDHPLRTQLIGEAQAQIVCETIAPMGEEERQALLAEALMRTKTRKAESTQLDDYINRLMTNCSSDTKLKQRLREMIDPNELRQFYEDNFRLRSKLEPESTLRSAARATTVVGKILDSMSTKRGVSSRYSLWIVRLGRIFWALVEVAVPRSFPDLLFRHWLKLIYFLEVLLIAGSTLLLAKEAQQFAITAFAITAAIHLAVTILRDVLQSENRWLKIGRAILIFLFVIVIVSGGLAIAAVFGWDFAWNLIWSVRTFVLTDHDLGFNLKTLTKVLLILAPLTVFLWTIRKDIFKKS